MLPYVNQREKQKIETTEFKGLVHKPYCPDGSFYELMNVNASEYPLLSSRKNSLFSDGNYTLYTPIQLEKYFIDSHGKAQHCIFYAEMWRDVREYKLTVGAGNKTFSKSKTFTNVWSDTSPLQYLVRIGNDIVIFPMAKIVRWNISSQDFELVDLEATGSVGEWFNPCDKDGNVYTATVSSTEPSSPTDGMVWCDTKDGGIVYKRYSVSSLSWATIPKVYMKVYISQSSGEVTIGDTIYLAAQTSYSNELDGYHQVINKIGDYIVITGVPKGTLNIVARYDRKVPLMDHVIECNNRLWGCRYGMSAGVLSADGTYTGKEFVNEIYCSKLGDPKNWRVYEGISTDSWAASNGTEGPWTGAVNYNGNPWFFKEHSATKVYISSTGAHQTVDHMINGIQNGSWKSICEINGVLFYKGVKGIYAFDGSTPVLISSPVNEQALRNAKACTDGSRYHMVATYGSTQRYFIYDTESKTWTEYDIDLNSYGGPSKIVQDIAYIGCGVELTISYGQPITVDPDNIASDIGRYPYSKIHDWSATSGIQFYSTPEKKYISRYSFRIDMEEGSTFNLELEYDSDGEWISCGSIEADRHGCYTLPVVPRRCDHLRYRISGTGAMKLYSITREYEGSTEK